MAVFWDVQVTQIWVGTRTHTKESQLVQVVARARAVVDVDAVMAIIVVVVVAHRAVVPLGDEDGPVGGQLGLRLAPVSHVVVVVLEVGAFGLGPWRRGLAVAAAGP
jgi:hypothetical protein